MHMPLDFENCPTKDVPADTGAYISAIAQKELYRLEEQAPNNILKIDKPLNFTVEVVNGQLEKPFAATTTKFDIGDSTFEEGFVVMKNLTRPNVGLHLMRYNEVVIDKTHSLIRFSQLAMQVKNAASETSAIRQSVLSDVILTIATGTMKTTRAFVDHPSEWNTTAVTPLDRLTETASLLTFHSMSTITDNKVAVRVSNTSESP